MTLTYPAGPITPHGAYFKAAGRYPSVHLGSHDGTVEFWMHGGESIPWPNAPECVRVTKDGIKNLIAPWRRIAQKGATEDGETFIDSLKDPAEPDISVGVRARDPRRLQQLVATLIRSIDDIRTAPLTVINANGERWWAKVRWNKPPQEPIIWGDRRYQRLTLRLLIDGAFWRSDPDISGLDFQFESTTVVFDYSDPDLADGEHGWDVAYVGAGGGHLAAENPDLLWANGDPVGLGGRSGFLRHKSARAAADNMTVSMLLGGSASWSLLGGAGNGLWGRMPSTGTPGRDGVRALVVNGSVKISSFVGGSEYTLATQLMPVSPQHGDLFELVCGTDTNPQEIVVRRNGVEVATAIDSHGASHTGADYRSGGLEMHAGPTILLVPAAPAPVARWGMSSRNGAVEDSKIQCVNIGPQPMYRDHVLIGPGTFSIGVAPGSDDVVTMGPLLENQVIMLRTDPRKTTIVDLTSKPPTPQQLNDFQQAVKDLADLASGGNAPPILQSIESLFGIQPPQGNLYSLLDGRFSTQSAIPPAPASGVPEPVYIKASIADGNPDSKIISIGIPLSRYPL